VAGAWQGGSGIFQKGVTDPLPQMEGAYRRSDFLEHGPDCVDIAPGEECQYFRAYPVATTPPLKACICAYADDFLFETAEPMYEAMTAEGHDATLVQFSEVGRGHSDPLNAWAWKVGCLGLTDACTQECYTSFAACFVDRNPREPMQNAQAYAQCFDRGRHTGLDGCVAQCAPTPKDAAAGGITLSDRRCVRRRRVAGELPARLSLTILVRRSNIYQQFTWGFPEFVMFATMTKVHNQRRGKTDARRDSKARKTSL
jgi:hypothetical protein